MDMYANTPFKSSKINSKLAPSVTPVVTISVAFTRSHNTANTPRVRFAFHWLLYVPQVNVIIYMQ